ncbi:uncharacterized protein LOC120138587 [Hibiscus syriacus]|uniref:uncharacterized protein LOC120138587 n=1 Tax=Hibiscus syriacus TaxID=106335 RepID=UPI0019241AFD|nr:uncharacterized protein LOC120138587 [Hibiscus syriacus]
MVERDAKIAEGLHGSNAPNVAEKSAHIKVKETERLFNNFYLHLVQDEEKRCGADKVDKKDMEGNVPDAGGKGKVKRPDLKAMTKMMKRKEVLYPQKRIGNIPGIDVGHQFYSRAEMVAVGFHSHRLNGIDFMGQSYRKGVIHSKKNSCECVIDHSPPLKIFHSFPLVSVLTLAYKQSGAPNRFRTVLLPTSCIFR